MKSRASSPRPTAFVFMTATLVAGFFVLTRLEPSKNDAPLNAMLGGAGRGAADDRHQRDNAQRLRAAHEISNQMIGALAADPYADESRELVMLPGRATPPAATYWPEPRHSGSYPAEADHPADSSGGVRQEGVGPENAPPDGGPLRTGARRYVVRANDSLVLIAERELGSKLMAAALIRANPVLRENPRLEEGMELVIPANANG